MYKNLSILLVSLLFLTACGIKSKPYSFTPEQRARAYTVRGETYYPLVNAKGFVERGHASWYGPGFHGKLTASGEVYNQNDMTAAHKHLPLGTYVYVQHLENKKIIRVKVNDRGPFIDDRVIDLSKEAAIEIGMFEQGVAQVSIATEKDDLDSSPTFIASRDNNANHSTFKLVNSEAKASTTSSAAASTSAASTSSTATASVSTAASASAAANPNIRTWSFQTSGKTYHDLRREQYPESLTSIYEDDGTHPNPSYASTLNNSQGASSSRAQSSSSIRNTQAQSSSANTATVQAQPSAQPSVQPSSSSANTSAPVQVVEGEGTVFIQLASYTTKEEAEEKAKIVHSLGLPTSIKSSGRYHVLRSGPYLTRKKASNSRAVLQFRFPGARVL